MDENKHIPQMDALAAELQFDPAFPLQTFHSQGPSVVHYGMSRRDYIATKIMSSIASGYASPQDAAREAVFLTDALIKELKK